LGKLVPVRVLVIFREQSSEELGMQFRSVFVIDGDLWGIQGLDQTTNEIQNLGLVIFY